jgi:hypothetical protein
MVISTNVGSAETLATFAPLGTIPLFYGFSGPMLPLQTQRTQLPPERHKTTRSTTYKTSTYPYDLDRRIGAPAGNPLAQGSGLRAAAHLKRHQLPRFRTKIAVPRIVRRRYYRPGLPRAKKTRGNTAQSIDCATLRFRRTVPRLATGSPRFSYPQTLSGGAIAPSRTARRYACLSRPTGGFGSAHRRRTVRRASAQ